MKKQFIIGFTTGAVIFSAVGAFAGQYIATENPFPIQLNGQNIQLEGYNIEGSTYFKLRDIANVVGGFTVDFQNNTIQLAKDGYVYDNSPSIEEQALAAFRERFNLYGADAENTTLSLTDEGDHYIVNAKRYTGDPDFPYDEWSCMVDKNTLELYNFAG